MYEHPIKRAGLSMSRILFSNTRMVAVGFPATRDVKINKYQLSFKFKTYENGKPVTQKGKLHMCSLTKSSLVFSTDNLDEALPAHF
jgi:hypothetical protein